VTDQDIQTVEALLAAFGRGDVEAMLDLIHPDGEWVNPDYAIEPGTRRGREEIRRAIERIFEFFETVDVESMSARRMAASSSSPVCAREGWAVAPASRP
jgi:ketosteroid isomerase-like protein